MPQCLILADDANATRSLLVLLSWQPGVESSVDVPVPGQYQSSESEMSFTSHSSIPSSLSAQQQQQQAQQTNDVTKKRSGWVNY